MKVTCVRCSRVIREVPDDQVGTAELATVAAQDAEAKRKPELCDRCKKETK